MMRNRFTRVLMGAAVATALIGTAGAASASSVLQIQFSGLDMLFQDGVISDAGSPLVGGAINTGDADPLVTMSFLVDGVNQGTLVHQIFADIYIPGVYGLDAGGGTVLSQGITPLPEAPGVYESRGEYGYFDLLLGPNNAPAEGGLLLDLDSAVQVTYSGNEIFVNGGGTTNGIVDQLLPFNLSIETPVEFSFSLNNLQNVTTGFEDFAGENSPAGDINGYLLGFYGSGTGEINGPTAAIPEPATLILVGLGLLGGGAVSRRKKNA